MALGMEYAKKCNADLLLATDPDCDRVGIAVKNKAGEYELLTGNQTGMLLLDYICSQRVKHGKMPADPVMVKTIVTMDMGEQIATHYGLRTINVLTGFKFIGEQIGKLEQQGKADSYVFGFEESYGYQTGSYVRDKDGVDGAYMIWRYTRCTIDSYSSLFLNSLINCLLRTSLERGQRRLPEPPESKIIFICFLLYSLLQVLFGTWNMMAEVMADKTKGKVILDETCENTNVVNELNIPILCMGCKDMIVAASGDGILMQILKRIWVEVCSGNGSLSATRMKMLLVMVRWLVSISRL